MQNPDLTTKSFCFQDILLPYWLLIQLLLLPFLQAAKFDQNHNVRFQENRRTY